MTKVARSGSKFESPHVPRLPESAFTRPGDQDFRLPLSLLLCALFIRPDDQLTDVGFTHLGGPSARPITAILVHDARAVRPSGRSDLKALSHAIPFGPTARYQGAMATIQSAQGVQGGVAGDPPGLHATEIH